MIRSNDTNDMFRTLIKSFEPDYVIHLTSKNKITNFDKRLIKDFQTKFTDFEDYLGVNIIDLVKDYRKYEFGFDKTLIDILNNCGTGVCAINSSFKHGRLKIPALYLLYLVVEERVLGGNTIKELQIYNYIEMSKFLSNTLYKNMFEPFMNLSNTFQRKVKEKSIFFAFAALKHFASFTSSEKVTKANQQQLANVMYPFHKNRKEATQRFKSEFVRPKGFIAIDKESKINELSLDVLEEFAKKNLVPFNTIDANQIIRLS